MNLYILKPIGEYVPSYDRLFWYSGTTMCFGVVVTAPSSDRAREMAAERAGDEGEEVWLDDKKTSCEILFGGDEEEVIICSYANA